MTVAVELIFKYKTIGPVIIWRNLILSHTDFFSKNGMCFYYDQEISISRVEEAIIDRGKPHFLLEFNKAVFDYGAVGNFDHSYLFIKNTMKNIDDVYGWVNPFLKFNTFIQGRVYDSEYEFLQNASDPLEFESAGISYDHLPLISNGLPFPLEKKIIDTSKNPGRRILRDGYVEALGSIMWLSDHFWRLTGTNKESVLRENWLNCEQIQTGVLLIKAKDALFEHGDGIDGELQYKLRTILFNKP